MVLGFNTRDCQQLINESKLVIQHFWKKHTQNKNKNKKEINYKERTKYNHLGKTSAN